MPDNTYIPWHLRNIRPATKGLFSPRSLEDTTSRRTWNATVGQADKIAQWKYQIRKTGLPIYLPLEPQNDTRHRIETTATLSERRRWEFGPFPD